MTAAGPAEVPAAASRFEDHVGDPHRYRRLHEVMEAAARAHPDKPAIIHDDGRISFTELMAESEALARRLDGWGVRPGDRLLVVSENAPALVGAILAASRRDVWVIPLNARLTGAEVDRIAAHSGARRILYTSGVSPEAAAHGARAGAGEIDLGALGRVMLSPENPEAMPEPVEEGPGQVAALVYTTGTTGNPKGVMITHANLILVADESGRGRQITHRDVVYAVLPMSHIFGLSSVLTGSMMRGATLRLAPRFDPDAVFRALADEGVTMFQGVPAMYQRLLAVLKSRGQTTIARPHLRYCSAGGSPLDPAVKAAAEALVGTSLHNGYGLTETTSAVSQTTPAEPAIDDSVGRPLPNMAVKVVDADDRDLPDGQVGRLWIHSPGVMKGYYKAPELTAEVMKPGGWFDTGDLARLDGGRIFIAGRAKELIIRSGFNVYPPEVEGVLNAHPDVAQSAVVGRTVPGNEEVVAFVQPVPGRVLTREALAGWVAERLAPYKRPAEFVIMDAFPATATGKVLKAQLKDMAAQG